MKPLLFKVPFQPENSFSVQEFNTPCFYTQWHYHHEIELTLIRRGRGTRLVGDNIDAFSEGDLILLGKNLPHMWRSDPNPAGEEEVVNSESIVIHFTENFWGDGFLQLPETKPIHDVLEQARRGLKIMGETRQGVSELMEQLTAKQGLDRLMCLLSIFQVLANSPSMVVLSSIGFVPDYTDTDAIRLNKIYDYTLKNFGQDITLTDIASIAHISAKSFCRYFKAKTHKTYTQFLTEVRVGHACRLLIDDKLSVSQVCYESGFNNLSNFNRQFRRIMRQTPAEYRKRYLA